MPGKWVRIALPLPLLHEPVLKRIASSSGVLLSIRRVHLGQEVAEIVIEVEGDEAARQRCLRELAAQGLPCQEA